MKKYEEMTYEELVAAMPPFKKKVVAPEKKVVALATANPEVPLERQRDRIAEAQRKLAEDQWRILQEERRYERWLAERQAALDFHMEMKLENETAARRFEEELDPVNCDLYGPRPCVRGK